MSEGMWEGGDSEAHSIGVWLLYTAAPNAGNDYKQRQRFSATDLRPKTKH